MMTTFQDITDPYFCKRGCESRKVITHDLAALAASSSFTVHLRPQRAKLVQPLLIATEIFH